MTTWYELRPNWIVSSSAVIINWIKKDYIRWKDSIRSQHVSSCQINCQETLPLFSIFNVITKANTMTPEKLKHDEKSNNNKSGQQKWPRKFNKLCRRNFTEENF